jgi:hypothetical protein
MLMHKWLCSGTNQTSTVYKRRMFEAFKEGMGGNTERTVNSVNHRWHAIQREVNKFNAIFSAIERRNESGKNERDRVRSLCYSLF